MTDKGDGYRLILCDDGGTLLGQATEAPIGEEGLARLAIGPLKDTMVDTFYWQLGTDSGMSTPFNRYSDVYSHRTDVAPQWGADRETFDSSGDWRLYENTRQLIEDGTDPPAVVIDHGHRAGLKVFLSMRVNDIHDGQLKGDAPEQLSPTKKEHREWLLGAVEDATTPHRYRGLSRFAYNFAIPDVRDYKLALANESIANYDLDGLDWDFCRFPRFFPAGQAEQSAGLMTDLMRKIRASLDEKSRKVGRRLLMSVRVPPTFGLARAFGMDVKTWMDEGLIDILIAGVVHRNMHRVPVEEFVAAARDTNVRVIVQNLGVLWEGRPPSASVIYHEPDYFSTEMCRASAATYWQAGVDGLYLWNNHVIEFFRDSDYDRQPWKEIGDPASIATPEQALPGGQPVRLGRHDRRTRRSLRTSRSVAHCPRKIWRFGRGPHRHRGRHPGRGRQRLPCRGDAAPDDRKPQFIGRSGLRAKREIARRIPCPPEAVVQRLLARVRRAGTTATGME